MMWRILLAGKDVIYNVGGDYRTTIADLARKIGIIMNAEVIMPPDEGKSLLGAPNEVSVNIYRFEDEFGKLPQINPELGLQRTVSWHQAISGIGTIV
jgi:nucleoside-diphosphate-sugar epimerase